MKRIRFLAVLLILSFLVSVATVIVGATTGTTDTEESMPLTEDIITKEALAMKVGSDNALKAGEKITLFTDENEWPCGAPYKNNGIVMVPLVPVLDYTGFSYTATSTAAYSVTVSGNEVSIVEGKTSTEGTVIPLTAAPVVKTFGTATSVMYIALNDVESIFEGYYVTYDESGLIYVSTYDNIVNRNDDEELMYDTAKLFIYTGIDFRNIIGSNGKNLIDVTYIGKEAAASVDYKTHTSGMVSSFAGTDEFTQLYNLFAAGTNNFTHPYIKTTQTRFDELNQAYTTPTDDAELAWYIEEQIAYADKYLAAWATVNDDGSITLKEGQWCYDSEGKANEGLKGDKRGWNTDLTTGTNHSVSEMPYTEGYASSADTGYGYDPAGGRLNILSNGETCLAGALEPVALAYQITRDTKYLDFAYKWMSALCEWEHWGPGHFLNCANTARPLATAYDWLYNDFVRVYGQEAVNDLAKRIYENAVYEAQITLSGLYPEHQRTSGDSSRYYTHTGNWNPVCTLGMLVASLSIMGEIEGEYKDETLYVIAASLGHYMERGMDYVTLDGGYRESAGYWGAVYHMHMINKVLSDTAGTDFGLMDYPGIDTADYFGYQMEGSSYVRWNYHDDWEGSQPSHWYYLSAELYDNPEYAAIRYMQIHNENNPKETHRLDLLYYNKETIDNRGDVKLNLDYSMTSIDATVVHSSYEKNSLFAGVMGGYNNQAHGQYDSGNWMYENMGVRWFVDLGSDNYNLYGGGRAKGYYKYSAEGNNTLALTSDWELLPHGQALDAGGELVLFTNNDYGSATVIDQNSIYAGLTEYARRGMLVTNDRRTFVIQDEVKALSAETFYWFAHYDTNKVLRIDISEDGRTVYMWAPNSDGEFQTLRVTLLSDNENLKFEIMDTHTFVLDTPDANYSPSNNGLSENARDNYMKLAVKAENVTELSMAVVVEDVTGALDSEVGYSTIVPMTEWDGWAAEKGPVVSTESSPVYTVYYNDGTEPTVFYTSRLSDALIDTTSEDANGIKTKANVERIECHNNVTINTATDIRKGQKITVNLNGNLLYQTSVVRVGEYSTAAQSGSLTVNDGIWYATSIFQLRNGATLRLDGVDYTSTSFAIRDEGAKVILDDSTLKINTRLLSVTNGIGTDESSGHRLVINNSEVEVGTSLIDFVEGNAELQNYLDVYVLGASAISIPEYNTDNTYNTDKLVANDVGATNVTINFHISEGVKLDFKGFVLPENVATDGVTHTYTLAYRTAMSMNADGTVNVGTAMIPYDSNVDGTDAPMYLISETEDANYPYTVTKVTPSFMVYYTDGSEKNFYSSELSAALPTDYADNGAYMIVLLSDATLTSDVNLGNSQQLVIDLSDRTLTATARITMGESTSTPIGCSVTVQNGKYVKTGGDGFCLRLGTTLILDNVDIESTSHVAWDNGATAIVFNECDVTTSGSLIYSRYAVMNTQGDEYYHDVIINNSSVNVGGSIFAYKEMTADYTAVDLYIIGSSCVSYTDMFSYAEDATVTEAVHNVHVEQGALVSSENLGLPENTEARHGEILGYESVTLADDYSVGEYVKYPKVKIVSSGNYYTVDFVSMVTGIKSTLTLYSDFTVNFYIPIEGNVIDLVIINGESYPINEDSYVFTDSGVSYYKLSVKNIAADKAAENIELTFSSDGFEENKTFSVIKYCELLLSDGRYKNSYALAASVVNYISAAYDYTGATKPEILTSMLQSDTYLLYLPEPMPASDSTTNIGNIDVALHGAQLDLGSSLKFRFNIQNSEETKFTGTIVINGIKYTVQDGMCDGYDYIMVEMRAFDMYDPEKYITISGTSSDGTEFSGSYDLRAYIQNCDKSDEKLSALMSALYTYCTESYSFKYGVIVERPARGDMPYVDAGI